MKKKGRKRSGITSRVRREPVMSTEDFKEKVCRMIYGRPPIKRTSSALVRRPGDAGYAPPTKGKHNK